MLLGPFDSIHQYILIEKLEKLMTGCNKRSIIDWIRQRNQDNESPKMFKNVSMIEDE
jgi:hypothetical protein